MPDRCTNHLKIWLPHLELISAAGNTVEMVLKRGILPHGPVNTNKLKIAGRSILCPWNLFSGRSGGAQYQVLGSLMSRCNVLRELPWAWQDGLTLVMFWDPWPCSILLNTQEQSKECKETPQTALLLHLFSKKACSAPSKGSPGLFGLSRNVCFQ